MEQIVSTNYSEFNQLSNMGYYEVYQSDEINLYQCILEKDKDKESWIKLLIYRNRGKSIYEKKNEWLLKNRL